MMGSSATAAAAMDGHKVFVYGSLMADEVVRVLLNRVPHSSTALLNSYQRFSIKGRVYPAILPIENKRIQGRVLFGITDPELLVLDVFEDVEYERRTVEVSLREDEEEEEKNLQVYAYVWGNKDDPDLYGEWDFEEWKKAHMSDFVKMTAEFMEEVQQADSKTRVATYESFYYNTAQGTTNTEP
ncbi:AIG2-like protein D [Linum grandiflorum]